MSRPRRQRGPELVTTFYSGARVWVTHDRTRNVTIVTRQGRLDPIGQVAGDPTEPETYAALLELPGLSPEELGELRAVSPAAAAREGAR
jgi:hypothetical protein